MGGISLKPGLIQNAIVSASDVFSARGVNSNVLPPEGEKCVPMQFEFHNAPSWKVDLSIALTAGKFSQLRSLYIDATQSSHNAIVYFPETGMTIEIEAGYSELVSLIEIRYGYVFYVSLAGQINDPNDTINIIAMNVMLPPFNTFNLFKPALFDIPVDTGGFVMQSAPPQHGITIPAASLQFSFTPFILEQINLNLGQVGVNGSPLFKMRIDISDIFTSEIFWTKIYTSTKNNIQVPRNLTRDYFCEVISLNRLMKGTTIFNTGFAVAGTIIQGSPFGNETSCNVAFTYKTTS